MRRSACIGLILAACLATGGSAAAQVVPDVEETTSDVVGSVTSTADDVVNDVVGNEGGVVGGATDGVGSGTDGVAGALVPLTGSGGEASGSTSARRGRDSGRAEARGGSSRPHERTRFDRLPRRLEALLERIELGRNVRANLRRLEEALESASPALRARVLRLIRAEIDRLQRGGTTPRERRRIERLRLALERLDETPVAAPEPAIAAVPGEPVVAVVAAGSEGDRLPSTGALGQRAEGDRAPNRAPESTPNDPSPSPFPPGDRGLPFVLGLVLLFLIGLGITGVIGGVINNTRRARSG
jgi:hypothetical protein